MTCRGPSRAAVSGPDADTGQGDRGPSCSSHQAGGPGRTTGRDGKAQQDRGQP